jgi:hypothetical protein
MVGQPVGDHFTQSSQHMYVWSDPTGSIGHRGRIQAATGGDHQKTISNTIAVRGEQLPDHAARRPSSPGGVRHERNGMERHGTAWNGMERHGPTELATSTIRVQSDVHHA